MSRINLENISTEQVNKNTTNIDSLNTIDVVKLVNSEDQACIDAIKSQYNEIANAIDLITETLKNNGRLIYIGAGTSGRLGVLDASECVPTFGVDDNTVVGIIAGGDKALRYAIEGAEDDSVQVIEDLKKINFSSNDVLCGIAASGRTPYVIGGLEYAKEIGAKSISLSNSSNSAVSKVSDIAIEAVSGPEVVTGSTRLKAGTTTKLVLNMLTTISMIKIGKVYNNLMVDVQSTNEKLIERAKSIVIQITGESYEVAQDALEKSEYKTKNAILMIIKGIDFEESKSILEKNNGILKDALR